MADGIVYYEWYFNDWLASATRSDMSLNDRAIYRDLLDHQAATGSLPNDLQALANRAMCSIGQMDAFMRRWGDTLFEIGEDGARRNRKLEANRDAILARLDKRRSAGVKGADARWKKRAHGKRNGKRIAEAMPRASGSDSDSSASSSGDRGCKGKGRRARAPDPIWDTIAAMFWPSGVTDGERPQVNRIVRDLKQKHATPDEIRRRAENYKANWPKMTLTAEALLRNWDIHESGPETPASKAGQAADRRIEQQRKREAAMRETAATDPDSWRIGLEEMRKAAKGGAA